MVRYANAYKQSNTQTKLDRLTVLKVSRNSLYSKELKCQYPCKVSIDSYLAELPIASADRIDSGKM